MRNPSRREIGRLDGRRAALNNEDEVDGEASHATGSHLLWFCGLWQKSRQARAGSRMALLCCGFVGCGKRAGRLAQAAERPCFVVVLWPASSLAVKPQHTGPSRMACLAVNLIFVVERRPPTIQSTNFPSRCVTHLRLPIK